MNYRLIQEEACIENLATWMMMMDSTMISMKLTPQKMKLAPLRIILNYIIQIQYLPLVMKRQTLIQVRTHSAMSFVKVCVRCISTVLMMPENVLPVSLLRSFRFFAIKTRKNVSAAAHNEYIGLCNSMLSNGDDTIRLWIRKRRGIWGQFAVRLC